MDDNNCITSINRSIQIIEQDLDSIEIKRQKNKEKYIKALDRILQLLEKNKFTNTKLQLVPPKVEIKGARSIWQNYSNICNQIKMNPEIINQYFYAQFNRQVLIRNQQMIILRQRIKSKYIQSSLFQFLKEQLICQQCKMADTKLIKDQKKKLITKECRICKATCTVEGSNFKYFKFP